MKLYEREVSISLNDAEKEAVIYCASPVWIRHMDALCERQPEVFRCTEEVMEGGSVIAKFYACPKKQVSVRAKVRPMTKEEREAAAARLRANLEKRKKKDSE